MRTRVNFDMISWCTKTERASASSQPKRSSELPMSLCSQKDQVNYQCLFAAKKIKWTTNGTRDTTVQRSLQQCAAKFLYSNLGVFVRTSSHDCDVKWRVTTNIEAADLGFLITFKGFVCLLLRLRLYVCFVILSFLSLLVACILTMCMETECKLACFW